MFSENSSLPGRDVAFFDEDAYGLASLLHGDDGGSDHPFGDRIGVGVDRELRRTFAELADRDGFASVVDRGALAFGFERKERSDDQVRRFVRKDGASGRSVVSGGSRGSDHEESVAAKPDAGVASDFDVERNQVASGSLDLRFVEGFAFGGEVFGFETHVEERVFEFHEFRVGAPEDRRIREEEPLGSEVHAEERGVFAVESLYRPEHGAVSTEDGDGAVTGFREELLQFVGSERVAEFGLTSDEPSVEYDGSSGDVQGFEAGHGMCGYGCGGLGIRFGVSDF